MENSLGVMQGRLSPSSEGKIQSFPRHHWREEFRRASILKLKLIEWVFEANHWSDNPLMSDSGIAQIKRLSRATGVNVLSVCADYFMDRPLLRITDRERIVRLGMLKKLIRQCHHAEIRYLGIPFVDASSISSETELNLIAQTMRNCACLAKSQNVILCLETDLNPRLFAKLLNLIHHPHVQVNYDIGNSASLGFDTVQELKSYGAWIATIHIKDRKRGGATVPLGTGDADFQATFSHLPTIGYSGPLILQAARAGDEIKTIRKYAHFVKRLMNQYPIDRGTSKP